MSMVSSNMKIVTVCKIVASLALAAWWLGGFATIDLRAQENSAKRHVDAQRLQGTLEKLSEFGRNPEAVLRESDIRKPIWPRGNTSWDS